VVDAVAVGHQRVAHPGQVQQPVPQRVVTGEAGDLQGQDDPDLAEADLGDQLGEPTPLAGHRGGHALVLVDDPHG